MKKAVSIAAALSISLFVYVFYRSEKTVVNELAILILSYDFYTTLRTFVADAIPLTKATVFSLPGGLWIFCVTALSRDFYMQVRTYKIQVVFLPILFAIGLEFCQLIHLTNGRFDVFDIAFYLMFWLLAYSLFYPKGNQQNLLSPFTLHGFICLACFLSVYLAHVAQ